MVQTTMTIKFIILTVHISAIALVTNSLIKAEPIQLSTFLPRLVTIHESCKALVESNNLLRAKILDGLQNQNQNITLTATQNQTLSNQNSSIPVPTVNLTKSDQAPFAALNASTINYDELERFNRWIGENLNYAVKNTYATTEALKEEARENDGMVDYSLEFIEDGQEGVEYLQKAVIFQDKALRNAKFEFDLN